MSANPSRRGICYLKNFGGTYAIVWPVASALLFFSAKLRTLVLERAWLLSMATAAPVVAALVHGTYLVYMGGDYMHGRLFVPLLFAALLPVAIVRVPALVRHRWRAATVAVPLLVWTPICAAHLRVPRENQCGIGDERGWYSREAQMDHPTALSDFRAHPFFVSGAGLVDRIAAACAGSKSGAAETSCRRLVLEENDDPPQSAATPSELSDEVDSRVHAVTSFGAIGIVGYLLPSSIHLVDPHGLADPIASRLVVTTRGRPGHEKRLPNAWVVASFAAPSESEPAAVRAARHAMHCGDLARLRHAVRGPLAADLFWDNLTHAWEYQKLRVPEDPFTAERLFCADSASPATL